jgi:uncharacterized protein (TIGR00255 family)|tara:strand:+ start:583 stop:1437 length:855 start_codon:yes stop_codon:yes gene_type:complete
MIYSMTGFGKDEKLINNHNVVIEIRSLNSKTLDLNLKIDDPVLFIDEYLRKSINQKIIRGKIDVSITINNSNNGLVIPFNTRKVKEYIKELKKDFDINESQIISSLLSSDKVTESEIKLNKNDKKRVKLMIDKSIEELNKYRIKEGEAISKDLKKSVSKIDNYIKKIISIEPSRIKEKKNKIKTYLEELENKFDKSRLEQEIIYYIEKLDINEEIIRLRNHLKFFISEINSEYAQGKKLSFISQEIGREINTIGSKANNFKIQSMVVNMKEENEKIKQNIFNIA